MIAIYLNYLQNISLVNVGKPAPAHIYYLLKFFTILYLPCCSTAIEHFIFKEVWSVGTSWVLGHKHDTLGYPKIGVSCLD